MARIFGTLGLILAAVCFLVGISIGKNKQVNTKAK